MVEVIQRQHAPTRQVPGLPEIRGRTYVLVPGSWAGGWIWAPVAERLRAQGHRVFTPTQTGLGERRHLLSRDIGIDTFVDDIANLLEAEDLQDVILVGHSFGGIPVTGVADRMPERIRHLVYLDTVIVQNGQSFFDGFPAEIVASRRQAAQASGGLAVPPPPSSAFGALGFSAGPIAEWIGRQFRPHPIGSYETPLMLNNPVGNGRPCTYVFCTTPPFVANEASRCWVKRQKGWQWVELASSHVALVTVPGEVALLLAKIE